MNQTILESTVRALSLTKTLEGTMGDATSAYVFPLTEMTSNYILVAVIPHTCNGGASLPHEQGSIGNTPHNKGPWYPHLSVDNRTTSILTQQSTGIHKGYKDSLILLYAKIRLQLC